MKFDREDTYTSEMKRNRFGIDRSVCNHYTVQQNGMICRDMEGNPELSEIWDP